MYTIKCTSKIILGVDNAKVPCEITKDDEDNDDDNDDSMPYFTQPPR